MIGGKYLCSKLKTDELKVPSIYVKSLGIRHYLPERLRCIDPKAYVGAGKPAKALTKVTLTVAYFHIKTYVEAPHNYVFVEK